MSTHTVLYEKTGGIACVTLNRPDQKNAIDQTMQQELVQVWEDFAQDDSTDVAILTGAGDAFCAGMDLKTHVPEFVGASPSQIANWVRLGLGGLPRGFHWLDKPVIAAVNGWSLAGGFELALAADIRIASERAMFGSFEARRGFHHGDGGLARLVNHCGVAAALELVLTAEPIDAHRAYHLNLVTRVVPHESLMETALDVARSVQANDQTAVRSAKRTILDMVGRQLDDQLYRDAIAGYTLMADNPVVPDLLGRFYQRTDPRRVGGGAS